MKIPDQNFNQGNNEDSPKNAFLKMAEEFKIEILNKIKEIQKFSMYPQNFDQYKADVEKNYIQTITAINETGEELSSKLGAELLISKTNIDFAGDKLSQSFELITDTTRKNFDNLEKIIQKIEVVWDEAKKFSETKDQEIKDYLEKLQNKYIAIIFEIHDERSKLETETASKKIGEMRDRFKLAGSESLSNEKLDKLQKEYSYKFEVILTNYVNRNQEIKIAISKLFNPDSSN